MAGLRMRPARPSEAAVLSEIALRSKAHWGYDAAFLEACRPSLTFSDERVRRGRFVLAEQDVTRGRKVRILGFYALDGNPPDLELSNMWVEPEAIGTGVGRALWMDAMTAAREWGGVTVAIGAEPNAEGFYRAMGATVVGQTRSESIPGRMLPLMRFVL